MSTHTHEGYDIEVKSFTAGTGALAIITLSGALVETIQARAAVSALAAARGLVDEIVAGNVEPPQPTDDPSFTGTLAAEQVRVDDSATIPMTIASADGSCDAAVYFNSTPGSSPTLITAARDAWKLELDSSDILRLYWFDGSAAAADDPITWIEAFQFHDQQLRVSSASGANAARLRIRGSDSNHGDQTSLVVVGVANGDLVLAPIGTGRVRFGTFTAIGSETLDGYLEVKDEAGNTRKLATIS